MKWTKLLWATEERCIMLNRNEDKVDAGEEMSWDKALKMAMKLLAKR